MAWILHCDFPGITFRNVGVLRVRKRINTEFAENAEYTEQKRRRTPFQSISRTFQRQQQSSSKAKRSAGACEVLAEAKPPARTPALLVNGGERLIGGSE